VNRLSDYQYKRLTDRQTDGQSLFSSNAFRITSFAMLTRER